MKNYLSISISLCLMVCISIPASAFEYNITFTGSGASTIMDSVVVHNLSKSTKVTVPAGMQLQLYYVESSVDELDAASGSAFVYPNPTTDNATFTFTAKNGGNTQIAVYKLDGTKITSLDVDVPQGKNSFQLSLPTGMYLIQAKGNNFSYTAKTIFISAISSRPRISFIGNGANSKPQRVPAPVVKLQYSIGDQLLYKGYSGNYCTIVTDKPADSKTTDFKFVECTDVDGNHYVVVHIGNQSWMAENLRYLPSVTSPGICSYTTPCYNVYGYNGTDITAAKATANYTTYGVLYNWEAAKAAIPAGWHLPTDAEWKKLTNFLGGSFEAGAKLKETGTMHWFRDNSLTTNESGFSAIPGGVRNFDGSFLEIGDYSIWWSATEDIPSNAWSRSVGYRDSGVYEGSYIKKLGFSVRCVKD